MLEHALRYAERGFAIIPVIDKKPAIVRWPKLASTDPTRIRKWWEKWPNASIGIVAIRSGIVVLDVDPRNGGDESLDRLVAIAGPELLEAPTVLSSQGGRHLYFVRPDDTEVVRGLRRAFKDLGIDLPAFVVAPPSMHASGVLYQWEIGDEETPPIVLPAAVIAASLSSFDTLRPPSLSVHGIEGDTLREITGKKEPIRARAPFSEIRAMLEQYARRFARPGSPIAAAPANDRGTRIASWVAAWIETPGEWIVSNKNSQAIRNQLLATARDYVRVYGTDGERFYRGALSEKSAISPAYRGPSPTSKDKRHPLAWEPFGKRAWDRAITEPTTDLPIDLDAMAAGIPSSEQTSFARAAAAYAALLLEAWRLGVRAENFRKDYAALARVLGVSKMTARRYVLDAEDFGLVQRLDAGKARVKGQRGESTSFFIATAKAVAFGECVETMVAQIAERRSRRVPKPTSLRLAG